MTQMATLLAGRALVPPCQRRTPLPSAPTPSSSAVSCAWRCRRLLCAAEPLSGAGDGDPAVQDTLEGMVRLQIAKEELQHLVQEEGAKMRLTGEEVRCMFACLRYCVLIGTRECVYSLDSRSLIKGLKSGGASASPRCIRGRRAFLALHIL